MFDFATLIRTKKPVDVAKASAILSNAKSAVGHAEQKLAEMRRILNEAIVDSQLGDGTEPTKARAVFDKATGDLTFARTNLEAAEAIHRASVSADEQAQHAAKIKLIEGHLAEREKDAVALAAAIENAVIAYQSMLLNTEKAEAVGLPLPGGSMNGSGPLSRAVEYELYRLGHDVNQKRSFPGGTSPSIMMSGQPLAIKPLLDELRQANAFAISTLKASRD